MLDSSKAKQPVDEEESEIDEPPPPPPKRPKANAPKKTTEWVKYHGADGEPYYHNATLRQTQWEDPHEDPPKPPPPPPPLPKQAGLTASSGSSMQGLSPLKRSLQGFGGQLTVVMAGAYDGAVVNNHYHEQADSKGEGFGASISASSSMGSHPSRSGGRGRFQGRGRGRGMSARYLDATFCDY
jgi:hypothetical protein